MQNLPDLRHEQIDLEPYILAPTHCPHSHSHKSGFLTDLQCLTLFDMSAPPCTYSKRQWKNLTMARKILQLKTMDEGY